MQNKTPHVIVCDDDVELNSFIRSHFKLDGYETHQALSAKECIDKLTELGDTIDAITVNGTIASDRSVMLILRYEKCFFLKVSINLLTSAPLTAASVLLVGFVQ
jgi:CheY-like chemotaxis protein